MPYQCAECGEPLGPERDLPGACPECGFTMAEPME